MGLAASLPGLELSFQTVAGCVTLGKLLNLSEPQFPQLLNKDNNNTSLPRAIVRIACVITGKAVSRRSNPYLVFKVSCYLKCDGVIAYKELSFGLSATLNPRLPDTLANCSIDSERLPGSL